jgi:hypothetical protein
MPIFILHSIGFSFHSCYIMIVNSQNVFMNGVKEDGELGEGFPLSMFNYSVGIGEAQGFGNGGGGGVGSDDGEHRSRASLSEVIIDKEFSETIWRFLKLKLLHNKNSCFSNLNSTKGSKAHGKD